MRRATQHQCLIQIISCLLLATCLTPTGALAGTDKFEVADALRRSLFEGDDGVARLSLEGLPPDIRVALAGYLERFSTFVPNLKSPQPPPLERDIFAVRAVHERRLRMVRSMAALLGGEAAAVEAAHYAADAALRFEWEGMSDGPLAEAAHAEAFLVENPETSLRPWLLLFLGDRLGRAVTFLQREGRLEGAARTAERAGAVLDEASRSDLILVRLVAASMSPEVEGKDTVASVFSSGDKYLELTLALEMTAAAVEQAGTDLADLRVTSAAMGYDDGTRTHHDGKTRRGPYWHIHWSWASPRLGGEVSARAYWNGEVVVERHGP